MDPYTPHDLSAAFFGVCVKRTVNAEEIVHHYLFIHPF